MHRQSLIFASLLIIVAIAIVATGYATGSSPLGVLSRGISRLTAGEQMIPAHTLTEETKAQAAPELSITRRGKCMASKPGRLCSG